MVKVGLVNSDPVYAYMSQAKLDMSAVSLQSLRPPQGKETCFQSRNVSFREIFILSIWKLMMNKISLGDQP